MDNNIALTFLQNKQNLKILNLGNVELYRVAITKQIYFYGDHIIVHLFEDLINLETLYLNYRNFDIEQYEENNRTR